MIKEETEQLTDNIGKELVTKPTNSPILSNASFEETNLNSIVNVASNIESMLRVGEVLAKSQLCPLKKAEDVVNAIITGNQYNLPFMTAINNIYPINGKATLGTHIIRGLILKHNIYFKKIDDYEPVYNYFKAEEVDGVLKAVKISKKVKDITKEVPVLIKQDTENNPPKELHIRYPDIVDRKTTYYFKREQKTLSGKINILEVTSSFSIKEAEKAGLLTKDNWNNYPSRMLDSRSFNFGAREIAADITLGMMSLSEMADIYDIPYTITNDLVETIVNE